VAGRRRAWWTLDRIRQLLVAIGALVLLVGVALLAIAATRPTGEEQTVWFTAIAATLALVGLLAVGATVYFALPSYRELVDRERARPVPKIQFQLVDRDGSWFDIAHESINAVPRGGFEMRLLVHNAGDAVLRWGILNIQVPIECGIEVAEPERPGRVFFTARTPYASGDLYDGETVPCNCAVAERDYPPVHAFMYRVNVTPRSAGQWPVAAVLEGYPYVKGFARIYLDVP
jgi:hypothetical protein